MLRLLDSAIAAGGTPGGTPHYPGITLSDVLNAELQRARLSDTDLIARCDCCRRKSALNACRVTAGPQNTYTCRHCGNVLLMLGVADCDLPGSYRLGRF